MAILIKIKMLFGYYLALYPKFKWRKQIEVKLFLNSKLKYDINFDRNSRIKIKNEGVI